MLRTPSTQKEMWLTWRPPQQGSCTEQHGGWHAHGQWGKQTLTGQCHRSPVSSHPLPKQCAPVHTNMHITFRLQYADNIQPMQLQCKHQTKPVTHQCAHTIQPVTLKDHSANHTPTCKYHSANQTPTCTHQSANQTSTCTHHSANETSTCTHHSANQTSTAVSYTHLTLPTKLSV